MTQSGQIPTSGLPMTQLSPTLLAARGLIETPTERNRRLAPAVMASGQTDSPVPGNKSGPLPKPLSWLTS